MENIAWLTICAICGSDKGEFNEEFMDIICPECENESYHKIAGNVMRYKSDEYEISHRTNEDWIRIIYADIENLTGISIEQTRSKTRKSEVVEARHVAMVAVKNKTKIPYKTIAWEIGRLDHSAVNHAIISIQKRMDTEPLFREKYSKVLGL